MKIRGIRVLGFGLFNLILPSWHLGHLGQGCLLRFFPAHPSTLDRRVDKILKLSLKRRELTIQIGAVDTIRVVRVLCPMLLPRPHGHAATLTLNRGRQFPTGETTSLTLLTVVSHLTLQRG